MAFKSKIYYIKKLLYKNLKKKKIKKNSIMKVHIYI